MSVQTVFRVLIVLAVSLLVPGAGASAQSQPGAMTLPIERQVAAQPLRAQVSRLADTLDFLGSPLPAQTRTALAQALQEPNEAKQVEKIQATLDPNCLLAIQINPESRVMVARGPAKPELLQQEWRLFLVKVYNQAGVTAPLRPSSPNMISTSETSAAAKRDRWLDLKLFANESWVHYGAPNEPAPPFVPGLSGLEVEYRILQVYSRDAGRRQAKIAFDVGQGTQDIGFRNEADILFQCAPTSEVTLHVRDENGQPATAMLLIRDRLGRSYPSQFHRIAPDFYFQPQVYRADGEKVRLPADAYTIEYGRGPEYLTKKQTVALNGKPRTLSFQLERWIDPSKAGWWSGDHHIHAAGCRHYTNPTAGVLASDMIRSCLGEDLKVGCNLTWGPCFDYQKQFFTGKVDKASQYPYLLRYDVEVSGFGSHESGHLCLLRLKEQIYPGGDSFKHWPKLGLSTLRWAKRQGAVCGPAHSGWGLEVPSQELPNFVVPPFNGIGANEYIVDVTHEVPGSEGKLVPAVDFMSTVDTPYLAELNIWYHTLNCGYRTRISGETDFPCISGDRVGKGRSYVKLDGRLDFDAWCEGIRNGRCYVSDGKSHLMDFKIDDLGVGEKGSELRIAQPATVHAACRVAALLDEKPPLSNRFDSYWHLERARIGQTREVPVEVVVNGYPIARKSIVADGKPQDVAFDVKIERSSWVTLRILGSAHTNPIFVLVGDKPIRASRRSVEWCLKGVDQCWASKRQFYTRTGETEIAQQAYDHAREAYRRILSECEAE
jgi:hypothetical protein